MGKTGLRFATIFACLMTLPAFAAPEATSCSCGAEQRDAAKAGSSATGLASCLIVSKPDGSQCKLLDDVQFGTGRYDDLLFTLFPRLADGIESNRVLAEIAEEHLPAEPTDEDLLSFAERVTEAGGRKWTLDWVADTPRFVGGSENMSRWNARLEAVSERVAQGVSATLGPGNEKISQEFKRRIIGAPERTSACLFTAVWQHFFPEVGPLMLDLPPYTLDFENGYACRYTQQGAHLTFAVSAEDVLYRYVITIGWPEETGRE